LLRATFGRLLNFGVGHLEFADEINALANIFMHALFGVRLIVGKPGNRFEKRTDLFSLKGALQLLNAFEENLRHCPRGRLAL